MAARSEKMNAQPMGPDAAIGKSFESTIQRHQRVDRPGMIVEKLVDSAKGRFFLDCKEENQIPFGLHTPGIKGSHGGQQRLDVPGVVADSRCVEPVFLNRGGDAGLRLKNRIQMSIKYD